MGSPLALESHGFKMGSQDLGYVVIGSITPWSSAIWKGKPHNLILRGQQRSPCLLTTCVRPGMILQVGRKLDILGMQIRRLVVRKSMICFACGPKSDPPKMWSNVYLDLFNMLGKIKPIPQMMVCLVVNYHGKQVTHHHKQTQVYGRFATVPSL